MAYYNYNLSIEHISGEDTFVSIKVNNTIYAPTVPFVMSAFDAPAIISWLNSTIPAYVWVSEYTTDTDTGLSYFNIYTDCVNDGSTVTIIAYVVLSTDPKAITAVSNNCGHAACSGVTASPKVVLELDCENQCINFSDITGAYALNNTGGYGSPNFPAFTDITSVTFTLLDHTGATLGSFFTTAYRPTNPPASICLTPSNFGYTEYTGNVVYQLKYTFVTSAGTCVPYQIPFRWPCCGSVLVSGLAASFGLYQQNGEGNITPPPTSLTFTDTTLAQSPTNEGGYGNAAGLETRATATGSINLVGTGGDIIEIKAGTEILAVYETIANRTQSQTNADVAALITNGFSAISSPTNFTTTAPVGTGASINNTPLTLSVLPTGNTGFGAEIEATLDNIVSSISINNHGSGYNSALLPPTIIISGGGGSGATATAVLDTNPATTTIIQVIRTAGGAYTRIPTISLTGAGGSGFSATPNMSFTGETKATSTMTVNGAGATGNPYTISVNIPGVGVVVLATGTLSAGTHTNPSTRSFLVSQINFNTSTTGFSASNGSGSDLIVTVPQGYGTDANSFTLIFDGTGGTISVASSPTSFTGGVDGVGAVVSVIINTAGSGFTGVPTVVFTGGNGSGAAATAYIGQPILSATITSGGTSYTSAPTVVISDPYSGSTAHGTSVLDTIVLSLSIINGGQNYSYVPTLTFSGGGGSGASATATLTNGVITGTSLISIGTGYTYPPDIEVIPHAIVRSTVSSGTFWGGINAIPYQSNPAYSDVSHTEFVVTRPDGKVVAFDIGYVPTVLNTQGIITNEDLGYGNSLIADGVYKIVYNVYAIPASSECLLASTTVYTLFYQQTFNCLWKQGIAALNGCDENAVKVFNCHWNELQMIIAASTVNALCVVGLTERLLAKCTKNCPTCV